VFLLHPEEQPPRFTSAVAPIEPIANSQRRPLACGRSPAPTAGSTGGLPWSQVRLLPVASPCRRSSIQAPRPFSGPNRLWFEALVARRLTQTPTLGAAYRTVYELAVEVVQEVAVRPVSKAVPGGPWSMVSRGIPSGARGGAGTAAWDKVGRRVEEEAQAIAVGDAGEVAAQVVLTVASRGASG